MMHHSGFMRDTILESLTAAGFSRVETQRLPDHNLLGVGIK
jgi:hypothetical protein